MNWSEFLGIMKMDEVAAEAKYKAALALATDPRVREILERLAYEEEIHVNLLEKEQGRLREVGNP
jgi:rubrerythrin